MKLINLKCVSVCPEVLCGDAESRLPTYSSGGHNAFQQIVNARTKLCGVTGPFQGQFLVEIIGITSDWAEASYDRV